MLAGRTILRHRNLPRNSRTMKRSAGQGDAVEAAVPRREDKRPKVKVDEGRSRTEEDEVEATIVVVNGTGTAGITISLTSIPSG